MRTRLHGTGGVQIVSHCFAALEVTYWSRRAGDELGVLAWCPTLQQHTTTPSQKRAMGSVCMDCELTRIWTSGRSCGRLRRMREKYRSGNHRSHEGIRVEMTGSQSSTTLRKGRMFELSPRICHRIITTSGTSHLQSWWMANYVARRSMFASTESNNTTAFVTPLPFQSSIHVRNMQHAAKP